MSTPKLCVVLDVEATCWQRNPKRGMKPDEPQSEIIEIGVTTIDLLSREIVDSEAIIVLPTTSEISEFCTELTTLTPDFVNENGISFSSAMKLMQKKYRVDRNLWASWGLYDRDAFKRQCQQEQVYYPFNNSHLNVKALFCWQYGFSCGLRKAADHMNIPFEGTLHRGVDDSRMIAKVLQTLSVQPTFERIREPALGD